jgi:NTP pyrophosphatase (non-canonical NTP hydrolase)
VDLNDYQNQAIETAEYPNVGENLVYPAMGCAGEGGEFCDAVKKMWRNTGNMSAKNLSEEKRLGFAKEIGDQMWYCAAAAEELGYSLNEVAELNLAKLKDRKERGVIKSSGDNR